VTDSTKSWRRFRGSGHFHQLNEAGLVGSKAEFSSRLLGKSPGYLTSMRARRRKVSAEAIMALDVALRAEVRTRSRDHDIEDRIALRHAMADVAEFLGNYPLTVLLRGVEAFSESPRAKTSLSL